MSTERDKEGIDKENWYSILVFLDIDPRGETADYIQLQEEIMCAQIVAFVVPCTKMVNHHDTVFNGIPIVSWERPKSMKACTEQHRYLYEITKAEAVIVLSWEEGFPENGEAGANFISYGIYKDLPGERLSVLIHHRLHGVIPREYESLTNYKRNRLKRLQQG